MKLCPGHNSNQSTDKQSRGARLLEMRLTSTQPELHHRIHRAGQQSTAERSCTNQVQATLHTYKTRCHTAALLNEQLRQAVSRPKPFWYDLPAKLYHHLSFQRLTMCVDRRDFLRLSAGVAGAAFFDAAEASAHNIPDSIRQSRPLDGKVAPISDDERRARIEKAQRLMVENRIDAIYLE